jgi:hypothetical protein
LSKQTLLLPAAATHPLLHEPSVQAQQQQQQRRLPWQQQQLQQQ